MAKQITVLARLREETGKNAMRRLRRRGLLPGVIFGRSGITTMVSLDPRELEKVIYSETGFNTLFDIDVEGQKDDGKTRVLIKHYQLDPVTHSFLHVSFYRIHMDREVEVRIPITAEGVATGVKDQGGTLDYVMRDILIRCLPGDIPDATHVEVTDMEIGDYVRVSELDIPEGVEVLEEADAVVLHLAPPRKVVEEVAVEEVAAEVEEGEEAEEAAEEKPAEEEAPAEE